MFGLFFLSTLSTFPIHLARAVSTPDDFSGIGQITVINSSDWRTADPKKDTVGCLDDHGQISLADCGTFARLKDYPWTLSSKIGNCSFTDKTMPTNNESWYGKSDHAWSCDPSYVAEIYDELYTIGGFPYTFLCWGDVACYYDAKTVPSKESPKSWLWQYRWGSQQRDITPGHTMIQLIWNKTGDLPKREDVVPAPGPRVFVNEKQTPLLQGQGIQ
ncbi:hypothetical protein BCR34DRAFT_485978 [Clohesyomyces aquaticus]|uniref:Uncharacterized protein n=1 Tax=Clohesyomyces aquaticus TaxID=1231657 RepID=A0A1Y1ZKB9_9PLEO|nr:hypothetical protein BCR34DRAFT_485978 [Clohesyomyces aquaticus]